MGCVAEVRVESEEVDDSFHAFVDTVQRCCGIDDGPEMCGMAFFDGGDGGVEGICDVDHRVRVSG
jgi:hypothetical protein